MNITHDTSSADTGSTKVIIKQNRELIGGLFWLVLALGYVFESLRQGLMLRGVPGPGFLPFLCGVILAVMSGSIVVKAIIKRHSDEKDGGIQPFDVAGLVRIIIAVTALFGYSFLIEHLGFAVTTFLFMLVTLRIMEPKSWKFTIGVSFIVSVISFVLFVLLLEVPLPKSPLGIF